MALTGSIWVDIGVAVSAIFLGVYVYFKHRFQYWQKRGFPVPVSPKFPMGNYSGVSQTKLLDEIAVDLYKAAGDERFIGTYFVMKPFILVKDLDLIRDILVKDFSSFHDRGVETDTKKDPLVGHLFMLNGQEWRNLRIKLIPAFTSGKMKMMFPTVVDVGKTLVKVFADQAQTNTEIEVKDILGRYTCDVISSVAFGIETNSLINPDVDFRKYGLELINPSRSAIFLNFLAFALPFIMKLLPFGLLPKHINEFFIGTVRDTMEYRLDNNVKRNDFMQLLLELKTLGYVKDADNPHKEQIEDHQKFTIEQAAAQAFLFFFAGFETSSSILQFILYELALNPDIQTDAQREIQENIEENGGKLTYDGMLSMDLVDRIVSETLRKYPIASLLMRKCNKNYPIPGSNLSFEKDDTVWISVYAIHYDKQYYADPQKFDPDRFLPEQVEARPKYTYMPFGEGPRNCIGNRFALMQIKVALIMLLSKFTYAPSAKTPIPIVFDPKKGLLAPKDKMHLNVIPREDS